MTKDDDFTDELRAAGFLSRWVLKRGFGQNFLLGEDDRRRVARCAFDVIDLSENSCSINPCSINPCSINSCSIIEIGAGPGGLTRALFDEGARDIVAIEQDRQFIPMLNNLANILPDGKTLKIIEGDARKLDFYTLVNPIPTPLIIIGNLPYSAATGILQNLLSSDIKIAVMALMFQREVAQRICAKVGDNSYARLSVLAGLRYKTEGCCDFAPKSFFPAPKVFSRVVRFLPRAINNNINNNTDIRYVSKLDYQRVGEMTALLFSYKRKRIATILRNAAARNNNYNIRAWNQAGEAVGINFALRAESIDTKLWLAWARAVNSQK